MEYRKAAGWFLCGAVFMAAAGAVIIDNPLLSFVLGLTGGLIWLDLRD